MEEGRGAPERAGRRCVDRDHQLAAALHGRAEEYGGGMSALYLSKSCAVVPNAFPDTYCMDRAVCHHREEASRAAEARGELDQVQEGRGEAGDEAQVDVYFFGQCEGNRAAKRDRQVHGMLLYRPVFMYHMSNVLAEPSQVLHLPHEHAQHRHHEVHAL